MGGEWDSSRPWYVRLFKSYLAGFEHAAHATGSARLHREVARCHRLQRQPWQEVLSLEHAIRLRPGCARWHLRLATVLERMGRLELAADAYREAISCRQNSVFRRTPADWHYCLGHVLEEATGDPSVARGSYESAIAADFCRRAKRFGVGVFHEQWNRWPQAMEAYRRVIDSGEGDAVLLAKAAKAAEHSYHWELADAWYTTAIQLKGPRPHWLARRGVVRERLGMFDAASEDYRHAAQSTRWHLSTSNILFAAGRCEDLAGRHREAAVLCLQSRGLAPQTADWFALHFSRLVMLITTKPAKFAGSAAWESRGHGHASGGEWAQAADCYAQALARSSTYRPGRFHRLASSQIRQGHHLAACRTFRRMRKPELALTPRGRMRARQRVAATYTQYFEQLELEPKTILYESFHGAGLTCNPYALFRYLLTDPKFEDWQHIWVVDDRNRVPEAFIRLPNVSYIARGSDAYLRALATAATLINNTTFPEYFTRKSGQIYLNTWHGTPIKHLGKDLKEGLLAHRNMARNFLQATHLLSQNSWTTDVLLRRFDISNLFAGKVAELGYPRTDLTVNLPEARRGEIRRRLGVSRAEDRLVLYAPTWRGLHGRAEAKPQQWIADLTTLAASGARVAIRAHHMVESGLRGLRVPGASIVPRDIDTNELLAAADVLVTDYSSIAFDYYLTGRPVIFYVHDLAAYEKDRGLYFPPDQLPGRVVRTREELGQTLGDVLGSQLPHGEESAASEWCPHDDGKVCEKVVSWLWHGSQEGEVHLPERKKSQLLFYVGPLLPNGIFTSWLNLAKAIDRDTYGLSVVVDPQSVSDHRERRRQFHKIPPHVQILGNTAPPCLTLEEKHLTDWFNRYHSFPHPRMFEALRRAQAREFHRLFGAGSMAAAIHFEGYNRQWARIFSSAPSAQVRKRVVYQHNDMLGEWQLKFPYLAGTFQTYCNFDLIVSVSRETCLVNRGHLAERLHLPPERFDFCDNPLDIEGVRKAAKLRDQDASNMAAAGERAVFVNIGRLSPEKDHAKLIRAFARLRATEPHAELIIIGDGPLRVRLRRLAEDCGVAACVRFLGLVPNPFPWLAAADCFVLSSEHEGQPMTLLEAMILGKPVVSTDIPGARSALPEGCGHLVPNDETGLFEGMLQFTRGELAFRPFDAEAYQNRALRMFYGKVCA